MRVAHSAAHQNSKQPSVHCVLWMCFKTAHQVFGDRQVQKIKRGQCLKKQQRQNSCSDAVCNKLSKGYLFYRKVTKKRL